MGCPCLDSGRTGSVWYWFCGYSQRGDRGYGWFLFRNAWDPYWWTKHFIERSSAVSETDSGSGVLEGFSSDTTKWRSIGRGYWQDPCTWIQRTAQAPENRRWEILILVWCERYAGMERDGSRLLLYRLCGRRIYKRMDGNCPTELQPSMHYHLDSDERILGCQPDWNKKSRTALYRSGILSDQESGHYASGYCKWRMGTHRFRYYHPSWLWRSGRYSVQTLHRIQRPDSDHRSIPQRKICSGKRLRVQRSADHHQRVWWNRFQQRWFRMGIW